MNGNELKEKLDELKTEDYIWLLYIGIIIISWYSNNVERKYFITGDLKSKEKYQRLMVLIFTILLVVYFYFTKSSYDDINTSTSPVFMFGFVIPSARCLTIPVAVMVLSLVKVLNLSISSLIN